MFKAIRLIIALWLIIILNACNYKEENKLRIAAAANMQFAMQEIVDVYEASSGQETELITGSSGKLTAQITNGAPYHIFFSADEKYPNMLVGIGVTEGEALTYAHGKLVLWTASSTTFADFSVLNDPYVQYIAIANPETAPYGRETREFLEAIGAWDTVEPKLVFGESVSQTTQFIETGTANIGFTSYSTVAAGPYMNKGHWIEVPDSLHSPIVQQMVIIDGTPEENEVSRDFVSFIQTVPAQQILRKYGYSIP